MIKKLSQALLSVALIASTSTPALALHGQEWVTSGSNIYNNNTGTVGIGTTIPDSNFKLHVNGVIKAAAMYDANSTNYFIDPDGALSAVLYGNVGIGTVNPGQKLEVVGGIMIPESDTAAFGVRRGAVFNKLLWQGASGSDADVVILNNPNNNNIQFRTNGAQRMMINNVGIVLIGASGLSPTGDLDVAVSSTQPVGIMSRPSINAVQSGQFYFGIRSTPYFNVGSYGSPQVAAGQFQIAGYTGTGTITDAYGLVALQPNFGTNKGAIFASGDIWLTGQVRQYSDLRLKTNITPISDSLSKIEGITGVLYNWKTDPEGTKKAAGVIAQDVMKVLPEAAFTYQNEKGEEFYGVHYEKLTALLIQGIKEQQKEINDLKQRLDALEKK